MQTQSALSSKPLVKAFQADLLTVEVYEDATALADAAAQVAADQIKATLQQQKTAAVILATGQSQLLFLDRFLTRPGLDWGRVLFFHMDEYLGLPGKHPASFRHYLRERVEQRVPVKAFHYLEGDALEPMSECERYRRLLQTQPIDLCLLGVGDNGHLAFNDPPVANFEDPYVVKIVKLDQVCRQQQVNQGHFAHVNAVPSYALTLTIPTLCSARRLLCLAPGKHKAEIVRTLLRGPINSACPASVLRRQSQAHLLLDRDSGRLVV